MIEELEDADCYLYRTNAALLGESWSPSRRGSAAPDRWWSRSSQLVPGAIDLQERGKTSHPDLCCFDSWTEVEEYAKTDEGRDETHGEAHRTIHSGGHSDALKNMPV